MKYVIIGGVAGGATAAARLRRNDENAEILLFEQGRFISYANCGMPYYIGGVIEKRSQLFLQTPESFGQRFYVDVFTQSPVTSIDPQAHTIQVGSRTVTYDKLLLSPGAVAVKPPLPGLDVEGVFTLRNVTDTDCVKAWMDTHAVRRAVVVGAGFIGLEMTENLHRQGIQVDLVESASHVMPPLDAPMAAIVQHHLRQQGVTLHVQTTATGFFASGRRPEHDAVGLAQDAASLCVSLSDGTSIGADMVLLSIGVRPRTELAVQAGLAVGPAGGIQVNEYLQTSHPDVYAVGDAIEFPHPVTGKPWLNFLAGPANRQGRIAADNMSQGNTAVYRGSVGTAIAQVFDLTVATVGLSAKRLQQEGLPFVTSITHSLHHASYYPNAQWLSIQTAFCPQTGRLYGAQIVGGQGADKRIDLMAQVVRMGGTVYDLAETEHAYAPPFSLAKDPVAIAGYVASNILEGKMNVAYWEQLDPKTCPRPYVLLDVRTLQEVRTAPVPGSLHIPLDDLRERLDEIPTQQPVYVFCAVGLRGYLAARILMQNGFEEVYNVAGGYRTYRDLRQAL